MYEEGKKIYIYKGHYDIYTRTNDTINLIKEIKIQAQKTARAAGCLNDLV